MFDHRLSHRVGRSSQATPAAVEKSQPSLTHRIQDTPAYVVKDDLLTDLIPAVAAAIGIPPATNMGTS